MIKFFCDSFCTFMTLEVEASPLANENTLEIEENKLLGNETLGKVSIITPLMIQAQTDFPAYHL